MSSHEDEHRDSGAREAGEASEAAAVREARGAREGRVIALRPGASPVRGPGDGADEREAREPLWRHLVGGVLRRERVAQQRTLKDVAEAARISMPYLSEVERGRKEASSEVLAAAAHALGLGLGDVLTRVQSELTPPVRTAQPVRTAFRRSGTPGNGAQASAGARPSLHRRAAPRQGDVRLAA